MNDLLVGCMVKSKNSEKKYIVLRTEYTPRYSYAWCADVETGEMKILRVETLELQKEEIDRLKEINKKLNFIRQEELKMITREELIDLDD